MSYLSLFTEISSACLPKQTLSQTIASIRSLVDDGPVIQNTTAVPEGISSLSHLCVCVCQTRNSCTPDHIFLQRLFLSDGKTKGRQRQRLNKIRQVITSHFSLTSCDKENMFWFLFPENLQSFFNAASLSVYVSHICASRFVISRREETVYLLRFPLLIDCIDQG